MITVFEKKNILDLEPITVNKTSIDIMYGPHSMFNRIENISQLKISAITVRHSLQGLMEKKYPKVLVNPDIDSNKIWLNGSVYWESHLLKKIINDSNTVLVNNGEIIGLNYDSNDFNMDILHQENGYMLLPPKVRILKVEACLINFPWDILNLIPKIIEDIKQYPEDISVDKNVQIDESNGPVIIEKSAVIEPFVYLKGPLYIGSGATILSHSKIEKSVIGPITKIKGEVYGCIFQGYSNKAHEGYIGNSFIGEWVNIGAGSTFSNLRNDYKTISMKVNNKYIDTKSLFLGSIIGDYSKLAIGTQLNTGTNIGIGCNVISHKFPSRFIPLFSLYYNDKIKRIEFDKFIKTLSIMKKRRNKKLFDYEVKFLKFLFNLL